MYSINIYFLKYFVYFWIFSDYALTNNNGDVFRYLLASCGGDNLVRLWKIYATTCKTLFSQTQEDVEKGKIFPCHLFNQSR